MLTLPRPARRREPPARRRTRASAWRAWRAVCAALADPSFELTIEEFAAVRAAHDRLVRSGVRPTRGLAELLGALARQAEHCDDAGHEAEHCRDD